MSIGSWREFLGTRVTVGMTAAVAALSVLTGIVRIGQQSLTGPFATVVPPAIQETVGFTGAVTGFLILASALGLRRGLRAAWYSTVVLLPVTALQGVLQLSPFSIPLIALSLAAMPTVLASRRQFDRELSVSTSQLAAAAAIVGAQIYGTVGAFALREQFVGLDTPLDAFYFTLVTASTVGYGDVAPTPTSATARLFGMSVILVGTASFAIALGTLLGPAIQARFTKALGRMTETQLELLENHLLILGHGDLTEVILEELAASQDPVEFVLITPDGDRIQRLTERDINVLVASPTDEESLHRAGIAEARAVLAATNDDADDALSVLTARQLNPDVTIVAAATNRENVEKLRRAGADTVISPATIGGHLLVESALGRGDVEDVARQLVEDPESEPAVGPDSGDRDGSADG